MSGLREALAEAIGRANRPSLGEGARTVETESWLWAADAVLRVLAEHGDTQQVREQVAKVLREHLSSRSSAMLLDAVMAIVAPIVAARDAAVEQAEYWKGRAEKAWERGDEDGLTALQLHADLAAARQQLDQVRALHTDLLSAAERNLRGNDAAGDAYQNAADALLVILDAPARPAGHDETGQ